MPTGIETVDSRSIHAVRALPWARMLPEWRARCRAVGIEPYDPLETWLLTILFLA